MFEAKSSIVPAATSQPINGTSGNPKKNFDSANKRQIEHIDFSLFVKSKVSKI